LSSRYKLLERSNVSLDRLLAAWRFAGTRRVDNAADLCLCIDPPWRDAGDQSGGDLGTRRVTGPYLRRAIAHAREETRKFWRCRMILKDRVALVAGAERGYPVSVFNALNQQLEERLR
jgi:hypothetical protein